MKDIAVDALLVLAGLLAFACIIGAAWGDDMRKEDEEEKVRKFYSGDDE